MSFKTQQAALSSGKNRVSRGKRHPHYLFVTLYKFETEFKVIMVDEMGWARGIYGGKKEMHIEFWNENLKERTTWKTKAYMVSYQNGS